MIKYFSNYEESVRHGIEHIKPKAVIRESTIELLETGQGSRSGCLMTLSSSARALALYSQFSEGSLPALKQWAFVAAKLNIMRQSLDLRESYLSEDLLWPLISDDEVLINWYQRNDSMFYPDEPSVSGGDKDNPQSWLFYRYQSWLALNGRWDELGERSERVLAMEGRILKDRSYLIDHRFYLALARGDSVSMAAMLMAKCEPKARRERFEQESGLTCQFIVSHATLFAKLATRHGFELDIETPWIPKDWLPVLPNGHYDDPWLFMKNFSV